MPNLVLKTIMRMKKVYGAIMRIKKVYGAEVASLSSGGTTSGLSLSAVITLFWLVSLIRALFLHSTIIKK